MAKVKTMAWDNAEKKVDNIIDDMNNGKYNSTVAKNKILAVDNVELTGIDEHNVDEVIDNNRGK
tara:strand:+ start:1101 stop:1292 length:192 start_codon:yes stop_codon:yes gene_type:complete